MTLFVMVIKAAGKNKNYKFYSFLMRVFMVKRLVIISFYNSCFNMCDEAVAIEYVNADTKKESKIFSKLYIFMQIDW